MPFIEGISTDRSFTDIDERFGGEISKTISHKLGISDGSVITVCDIACGPKAQAIQDIVRVHAGRITGLGLDFHLDKPSKEKKLLFQTGDLFSIGADFLGKADVTYCAYILGKLAIYRHDYLDLISKATEQISRTLREGGIAFIDEGIYSLGDSLFPIENLRRGISAIHPQFLDHFTLESQKTDGFMGNYLKISRNR